MSKSFAQHAGRLIAIARLLLATQLVIISITDPRDIGFRLEPDDVLAVAYIAWALTIVVIAWQSWWWDFRLSGASIVADCLLFCVATSQLDLVEPGGLAASIATVVYVALACALRLNVQAAIRLAIVLNLWWLAVIAVEVTGPERLDVATAVRAVALMSWASLLAMLVAPQMSLIPVDRFRADVPADPAELLPSMLAYAMHLTGATGAALQWRNLRNPGTTLALAGSLDSGNGRLATEVVDHLEPLPAMQMLFDLASGRTISLVDGTPRIGPAPTESQLAFFQQAGVTSGIYASMVGIDAPNQLVLFGIPGLSWGHLNLLVALASELERGTSEAKAFALSRDVALAELRHSLARDLHDSLAQSMAGTKFWLRSLRDRVAAGYDALQEIDVVRSAIESEHASVRAIIAQLRRTEQAQGLGDLGRSIGELLPVLESQWSVSIGFKPAAGTRAVPIALGLAVEQIIREAVANAVRHGGGTMIGMACGTAPDGLTLSIEDDGKGFADSSAPPLPRSIAERVASLNGSLQIETQPGRTVLHMRLPIEAEY